MNIALGREGGLARERERKRKRQKGSEPKSLRVEIDAFLVESYVFCMSQ